MWQLIMMVDDVFAVLGRTLIPGVDCDSLWFAVPIDGCHELEIHNGDHWGFTAKCLAELRCLFDLRAKPLAGRRIRLQPLAPARRSGPRVLGLGDA